jgi:serine/threonine protein kinase
MFGPGDVVELDSGKKIRLEGVLAPGGQGTAYTATDLGSGQQGVFKVFHSPTSDTVTRLRYLVGLKLQASCPVLIPPIDMFSRNGLVGTYAPLASGQILEEFLVHSATLVDNLQLGVALARAIQVLHEHQVVHGDLHAGNLIVRRDGSVLKAFLIDLDNFKAAGVPEPPCVGHELYMAPELRLALANHRPAVPDECSERYSLGVMLHEILLALHPASGADKDQHEFYNAMLSGWMHDPARADRIRNAVGGLPIEVLNANLMRMFRRSLSRDRIGRPTAADWVSELSRALTLVFVCPRCGGPCLIDASKTVCPFERQPFPQLKLLGAFGEITLQEAAMMVGRSNLGGSFNVSARHAILRRHGPEYLLESVGQNGTQRWANGWIRLPDRQPVLIQKGDRLKFADVDAQVLEA